MTLYGLLFAVATVSVAVILGLGLANGGSGGEPDWPIVAAGLGLLLCKLVVFGAVARHRRTGYAEDDAYCRPCREGEHCGERGPDCGYGCACPCPIDRRD